MELLQGSGVAGAACAMTGENGIAALLPAQDNPLEFIEVTLPSFSCRLIWVAGLVADRRYDVELAGSNLAAGDAAAPGVPLRSDVVRANAHGIVEIGSGIRAFPAGSRLAIRLL